MKKSNFTNACVMFKQKEKRPGWLLRELGICFIIAIVLYGIVLGVKQDILIKYKDEVTFSEADFLDLKDVLANDIVTEDGFDMKFLNQNEQYTFEYKEIEKLGFDSTYKVKLTEDIGKRVDPEIRAVVTSDFKIESYDFWFDSIKDWENYAKYYLFIDCLYFVMFITSVIFMSFYIVITVVNYHINK